MHGSLGGWLLSCVDAEAQQAHTRGHSVLTLLLCVPFPPNTMLHVPPGPVNCSLPQVNRCVRCAESGTFSLHPDRSCQPCVPGGLCSQGLLQPREGYWSSNPFVPQIIPCPLKDACANRHLSGQEVAALVPWLRFLQQEQQQVAQQLQHQHPQQPQKKRGSARAHRQLLQASAATPSIDSGSGGSWGAAGQQPQQQVRMNALQAFNRQLADLITHDPEQGPFRLYNITYRDLLHSWQGLQCNRG